MSKFTPWFPGHIKPVRVGVYQQRGVFGPPLGYQHWDGSRWFVWCETAELAAHSISFARHEYQNDPWRGLANDPKEKP